MLKSMNFLSGKSRERAGGGTKSTPPAPVILGLVPRILWKQGTKLVNKLVLLFHKCWLREDSWDKPKNDWCRGRGFSLVSSKQRSVAVGNKVMDTRLPQPAGCGDKYDVSGLGCRRLFSAFCMFFKYPSPDAKASPSPARGEGLHRPWCHKILGTGPSMTGARGAGFVRLLLVARNDGASNGEGWHRPWCDKILGTRPRMTGGRDAGFVRLLRFARNDVSSVGRSMIEMLGVLAIVAVLSVGGIVGYSKAMEQFKINKTLEHYNYLVLGMLDYVSETKNLAEQTNTGMTMIAEAAGLIPATWQKENNFNLRDDMANIVQIFANKTSLSIDYIFQNSEKHSITDKLCNNLFNNTLKPLSDSIQVIYVTIAGKIDFAIYYGNTICDAAEAKKCLRDVELNDIRDSCNFCAEQKFCSIAVKF